MISAKITRNVSTEITEERKFAILAKEKSQ